MARAADFPGIEDFWQEMAARAAPWRYSSDRFSIVEWGRQFLPHYFVSRPSMMHEWLDEQLSTLDSRRGTKIAVIGPRGSAKSTIVSQAYVLRQAVEGRETLIFIICDTREMAAAALSSIKDELDNNERLADEYPEACGEGPVWQSHMIRMRNGVVIRAIGTRSKIRGMKRGQSRPSLIVLDDPENDNHTVSSTQRDRSRQWFQRAIASVGAERTNFLALGTMLHRECLVSTLMRTPGWVTRRVAGKPAPFQSVERWPRRMDLWRRWEEIYSQTESPSYERDAAEFYRTNERQMVAGATLLWPDRDSLIKLMQHRAEIGHASFDFEHQGVPIDPTTCEWPESYTDHDELYFDEWPLDGVRVVSVDPSKGKDATRGDYCAIMSLMISSTGVVYVEPRIERVNTTMIVQRAVEAYMSLQADVLAIETNQFQELLLPDLEAEAAAQGTRLNIEPVNNLVNKMVRIRRLTSLLHQRRLKIKSKSQGATLLVQQLREFPNCDHDDGPDALEMGVRVGFQQMSGFGENVIGSV